VLHQPGLDQLAAIVRGADTSRLELTPQSAGLYALSLPRRDARLAAGHVKEQQLCPSC
jgi:hypothetical protein